MFLAVDIGNTNITLGIFAESLLKKTIRLNSDCSLSQKDYEFELKKISDEFAIDSCAIVSVKDELTNVIKSACDSVFKINSLLFENKNCNIKINVENPEKIGSDRLVNAYATLKKYPLPVIVVDAGTAITFDVISKNKEFIGGVIMPGINLQLKSLNQFTSKLPLIAPERCESAIGNNTKKAILSGVLRGCACAIEGLIKQCESELGESATIITTGGQCSLIAEYMTRKVDYINPDLTLEGLNLFNLNAHVNLY